MCRAQDRVVCHHSLGGFGHRHRSHIFHHSQLAEWASKSGYYCKQSRCAFLTRSVVYTVGILDDLTHDYYVVFVQQLQLF